MKKIIMALLVILLCTAPYLAAQEPDVPVSIEGTQWITSGIRTSIEPPYFSRITSIVGFDQGVVYSCNEEVCIPLDDYSYIDLPVVSIAYMLSFSVLPVDYQVELLIMQPAGGFGQVRDISWWREADCLPSLGENCINGYFTTGTMIKIDDNWTPAEAE
jgi:hypothetical protein